MLKIGLLGSNGRMGLLISKIIKSDFLTSCRLEYLVGRGSPIEPILLSDVVIDVSNPEAMISLVKLALQKKEELPSFVVGSTGWTSEQINLLKQLSQITPVLISSNFSVGIHILSQILRTYSPLLQKIGYTPILLEAHHIHKKDAPSGTALNLQNDIDPLNPKAVQTHSIRAGEIIGSHEIKFFGPFDQITLQHSVQERKLFAKGAVEVAMWLFKQKHYQSKSSTLLTMDDYFNSLF